MPEEHASKHLPAISLTHAHLDHFRSLGANLHDVAPVSAISDTVGIVANVLASCGAHNELLNTNAVLGRLEPMDGWTLVVPGVRVHPVSTGHDRGAADFLFVLEEGDECRTVLVNGDFSTRPAAGNAGLPLDRLVDAPYYRVGRTSPRARVLSSQFGQTRGRTIPFGANTRT